VKGDSTTEMCFSLV